jgi:kynureninase
VLTQADLAALDQSDPLASFRDLFALTEGVVYLDGNSLGPLPRATPGRIADVVGREWGEQLIGSWNSAGWMDLPTRIGDKIARLIGAAPGTTVAGESTSVNVYRALGAALAVRPDRRAIVSERGNFPTDLYLAEGLCAQLGRGHRLRLVEPGQVAAALDDDVAALLLTHVNYRTGAMHDMARVTAEAHAAGAVTVWDLAHSVAAVPVDLAGADADFAVGCGYKFLNGGPGAPGFLYVAPRLRAEVRLPLTGWLGHAAPFAFEPAFRPAPGSRGAVIGTPAVLGLAALEMGVDIALGAPMRQVREKSLLMSRLFAALVEQACPRMFTLVSPGEDGRRGSQVCLSHPDGYAIVQALIARGVIGDFRAPDILRFGMTPLYLRHTDLWRAAAALGEVMAHAAWREPRFQHRLAVT